MYLLASSLHDPRDLQQAAALLSAEFSRVVSAQQVPYLMENRLRTAGIIAVDSGTQAAAFGDLHRVDIADQVTHAGIGSGEFFGAAQGAVQPGHRQVVAEFGGATDRAWGDRLIGVFSQLGAFDDWGPLIEQSDERAE